MIRKTLISLFLLLILAAGGVFFYLDAVLKGGIEIAGSGALQTPVTVASVSLSPLSGNGAVRGLTVANLEDFSSPYAFQLGEVSLAMDTATLFSDVIEIDQIVIDSPIITYEARGLRNDNIRALLAKLPQSAGGEGSNTEAGGPEFIIRELQISNPRLDLVTAVASAPVLMPDILLTDIGTASNGATVAQVIQQVLSRVNEAIIEGRLPGVDAYREQFRNRLRNAEDGARQAIDDAVEEIGDSLRNILN